MKSPGRGADAKVKPVVESQVDAGSLPRKNNIPCLECKVVGGMPGGVDALDRHPAGLDPFPKVEAFLRDRFRSAVHLGDPPQVFQGDVPEPVGVCHVFHAAGVADHLGPGIGFQQLRHASPVVEMDVGQEDQVQAIDMKLPEGLCQLRDGACRAGIDEDVRLPRPEKPARDETAEPRAGLLEVNQGEALAGV